MMSCVTDRKMIFPDEKSMWKFSLPSTSFARTFYFVRMMEVFDNEKPVKGSRISMEREIN